MSPDFLLSVFRVEKKIAGLRPQGLFPPAPEVEGIGKGHDESSTQTARTSPSESVGTRRMASRQVESFRIRRRRLEKGHRRGKGRGRGFQDPEWALRGD